MALSAPDFPPHPVNQTPRDGRFLGLTRAWTMPATISWDDLTRFEQRPLIKLSGCGTTRNENPAVADGLRSRGLVEESDNFSMRGLLVLTIARDNQHKYAQLTQA